MKYFPRPGFGATSSTRITPGLAWVQNPQATWRCRLVSVYTDYSTLGIYCILYSFIRSQFLNVTNVTSSGLIREGVKKKKYKR